MIYRKNILIAVAFAVLFSVLSSVAQSGFDLNRLLSQNELWNKDSGAFLQDFQVWGFHFVDGQKVAVSNHADLKFNDFKVWEARFYFKDDRVSRVDLSLYNKGDSGELSQAAFEKEIGRVVESFTALTGSRGVTGKVSNDRANYYVNRRSWKLDMIGIQLEWAFVNAHRSNRVSQPFRAEFIKVILAPVEESAISGKMTAARPDWASHISARTLKVNVKQNKAGDILLAGIPMVDQGQKGYCAAASAERVLRYYGWQGDQHEIAQLADTAAQGGTTLEGMVDAVAVVGRRYQLNDKALMQTGESGNFEKSEFFDMIRLYNREAKSNQAVEIDYLDFCEIRPDNAKMIDVMAIFEAMDPAILKASKVKQSQAYTKFQQNILNYVKQGVPLFWACFVGKYPENPDLGINGIFGHIRLIIGINQKTKELIYSDSWGPGHELKRMPLDDAWSMTFGLTVLKPRDVR